MIGRSAHPLAPWTWVAALALLVACGGGEDTPTLRADAGADRVVEVGTVVALDASASEAPRAEAGPSFAWTWSSRPAGSSARLADADTATPSFEADAAGDFVARVTVSDGTRDDADTVTITAVAPESPNRAPIADAGPDLATSVGEPVTLDAGASRDPDGDALTFAWTFVTWPNREADPAPALTAADGPEPSFTPDAEGSYTLEVTVADGELSASDRVTIAAAADAPTVAVFVDPAGDDADPGTEERPVRTVGRALDLAAADGLGEVRVAAGSYDEEPFDYALETTVRIRGDGAGSTILDAGDAPLFTLAPSAGASEPVALYLEDVTLRTTATGVAVPSDSEAHLRGVACDGATPCVHAAELAGILPAPGGTFTFRDGTATGAGAGNGFVVAGSSHLLASSRVHGYGAGVYAFASSFHVDDVAFDGNDVGVHALGSVDVDGDGVLDPLTMRDSVLEDNGLAVRVRGATVRLTRVTVTGSLEQGVLLEASNLEPRLTLVDTEIRGSGASGLRADQGVVDVSRGVIAGNGVAGPDAPDRAGLRATGAARIVAVDTEIRDNAGHGAAAVDEATLDLRDVISERASTASAGVYVVDRATATVQGGSLRENRFGVYAGGDADVGLVGVTIDDNRYAGVSFRSSGELYVRDAVLRRNGHANVQLRGAPARVDLGVELDPGDTWLVSDDPATWNLADERPNLADADGTIAELHGVDFFASSAVPTSFSGLRTGPDLHAPHWTIDGENQRVRF